MKIRGLIIVLLLALSSAEMSYALQWHDIIIKELTENPDVKTNMVVERNVNTRRISKANYKFTFKREEIANMLREAMLREAANAVKFSIDDNMILMQLYEPPGLFYNYKLSKIKDHGEYQFLVSIGKQENPSSMIDGDRDFNNFNEDMKGIHNVIPPFNFLNDFILASNNSYQKEIISPTYQNSSYAIILDNSIPVEEFIDSKYIPITDGVYIDINYLQNTSSYSTRNSVSIGKTEWEGLILDGVKIKPLPQE